MQYRKLGNSGLRVSELCLGTMTFGDSGPDMWSKVGTLQTSDAKPIVKAALDAGINFIDTANVYSFGHAEEVLGQSLKEIGVPRDDVVIATKVFGAMGDGINNKGGSRRHILAQAEDSLKRLQVDHIDLYQLHGFDPETPIEETLTALDNLVQRGLVRYIGLSNWAAWQVVKAVGIAELRRLSPILSLQAYYSLAGRDLERDIVPMLLSENIGLMVWSPLAGGLLSGKFTRDGGGEGRRADFDFPPVNREQVFDIVDAMRPIAEAHGASVPQVALAWLLHQPAVTSVIVGAKSVDQLTDNIGASGLRLGVEDLSALDAVSALQPEYPGWMQARQQTSPHTR
ncbi:aldo/keto reductase [Pelagovum pacificum]|uniref:Aldo/keto reductase n=1 Tax=Pelagovum pacificum TaxID=2588711 RepID=A0A5C5GHG7_9RHOB|nr:aldo/keto reductase [Pelagovum pacificum]QQA43495.1 aldo/keto reductase [Pelagovum pacificum]TNY33369.1 aldo/keto reductase [Pelagovum pacificum]